VPVEFIDYDERPSVSFDAGVGHSFIVVGAIIISMDTLAQIAKYWGRYPYFMTTDTGGSTLSPFLTRYILTGEI
jgi:hypothetical protein